MSVPPVAISAVKFGLTDRHGAAPYGAAPRDDMTSDRGG